MSLFQGVDWGTVILYLVITLVGLAAVFSASYVEDAEDFFSFKHFYVKHMMWLGISYVIALVILLLDRSMWH